MQQTVEKIDSTVRALDEERKNILELDAIISENLKKTRVKIKLSDGKQFEAYKENLVHTPGSVFCAMFETNFWKPHEDGAYHFDRPSECFERIIEYAESGKISYKGLNDEQRSILEDNMQFFFPQAADHFA